MSRTAVFPSVAASMISHWAWTISGSSETTSSEKSSGKNSPTNSPEPVCQRDLDSWFAETTLPSASSTSTARGLDEVPDFADVCERSDCALTKCRHPTTFAPDLRENRHRRGGHSG